MAGKDLVPVPSPRPRNGGNGGWPYAGPGRFPTYSVEAAQEILDRTAAGEPMAWICRDEHMPDYRTVYDWIQKNPKFASELEICKQIGNDSRAAWALEESYEPRVQEERTTTFGARGQAELKIRKYDNVNRSRLIVDTTMKLLGQWDARYRQQAINEQAARDAINEAERITIEGGLPPDVTKTNGSTPPNANGHDADAGGADGLDDPTNGETP